MQRQANELKTFNCHCSIVSAELFVGDFKGNVSGMKTEIKRLTISWDPLIIGDIGTTGPRGFNV